MTKDTARNTMLYALAKMKCITKHQHRYSTKITSRAFSFIRTELAIIHSVRIVTAETRAKISAKATGRQGTKLGVAMSDVTKKKLSDKAKLRTHESRLHSEVTKKKIATSRLGKPTKGNKITINNVLFSSIAEACRELNITRWEATKQAS